MSRTELAPRRQQFHVAPACNNQTALSVNIKKMRYERLKPLIQNHTRHEHSESAREQRIALYILYVMEWSGRLQPAESVKFETIAGVRQSGFILTAADSFQHTQNPHSHA